MGHWLSQQHDVTSGDELFKRVETWKVDNVQMMENNKVHASNRFSISESGMIGMSCGEKPSLSVMYPGKDISPTVLSKDKIYRSATFVKVSDKEYLAASCKEDGCLYLWDIESKTLKKVFDPKLPSEQHFKDMNICKIDKSTIGYGEVAQSSDGSRRVFILQTDTQELTLSSMVRLFTPNTIFNMCYTEVDGGTPCLLLCIPWAHQIMAVQMVGGKTRWEAGEEQMAEKFFPWSICTDDDNTVYVADFGQFKIHLVSVSDGTVIKRFDGRNLGIYDIFTLRFHDQHLYMEHYQQGPNPKYAISKFKETEER